MLRRGYVSGWQNRHHAAVPSGWGQGSASPDIPDSGKGYLQNYWTSAIRGRAWDWYTIPGDDEEDDETIEFLSDVLYASTPFISGDGTTYRFIVHYHRDDDRSFSVIETAGIAVCKSSGTLSDAFRVYESLYDADIGLGGYGYTAYRLYRATHDSDLWYTVIRQRPQLDPDIYRNICNYGNSIYTAAVDGLSGAYSSGTMIGWATTTAYLDKSPFTWDAPSADASGIVARARSLSGHVYWYGGAGQTATVSLANQLRSSYPSVWTESYYNKALNDIGKRVADCSYLVNYAYNRASPGSHGPGTSSYLAIYSRWSGAPKNGMILWRSGHTGIYADGKSIEMSGIDTDYIERDYNAASWSAVLYDSNIDY